MKNKIKKLSEIDFSLIELILIAMSCWIILSRTFVYFNPSWKSFAVLAIVFIPGMYIVWTSVNKYVQAYKDVIVTYLILVAIVFSFSTIIYQLRHAQLYYVITFSIIILYFTAVIELTEDEHLKKRLDELKIMTYYVTEVLNIFYMSTCIVGIFYFRNVGLSIAMAFTYFITKLAMYTYVRWYINVRAEKKKNNK